jgi:hypothetical protein
MSKLIAITDSAAQRLSWPDAPPRPRQSWTTSDYRRILSDLRLRPPSQRAFLRKLLKRALLTGAPTVFPAVNRVVPDHVSPL